MFINVNNKTKTSIINAIMNRCKENNFDNLSINSNDNVGVQNNYPLWFLDRIEKIDNHFLEKISSYSFNEMAKIIMTKLLKPHNDFCSEEDFDIMIDEVVDNSFTFPVILKELNQYLYIGECFHGPTMTFKDFGARFMANFISNLVKNKFYNYQGYSDITNNKITIVVATSGDTGSAIADAFFQKPNIDVVILYPKEKITNFQELQMITYGKNITAIGINGTFDDCQAYVKKLLNEPTINGEIISANSINIARLLPQTLYYFYFYAQLQKNNHNSIANKVIFSIPCGNCGNLTGAIIAKKMGLPIKYLIAGQNSNNTLCKYINSGVYEPKASRLTISNAMDVGNPNNFNRIKFIYEMFCEFDGEITDKKIHQNIEKDIKSTTISEVETSETIKQIWFQYNYIIDPHTAVAIASMDKILKIKNNNIKTSYDYEVNYRSYETNSKLLSKNCVSNTDVRHTDVRHTDVRHTDVRHTDVRHTDVRHTEEQNDEYIIVISTAKPEKFKKVIEKAISKNMANPYYIKLLNKQKENYVLKKDYLKLQKYINFVKNGIPISGIQKKYITLIGMPGCGKTTVSKKINESYNINYIDTDHEIESIYGMKLIDMVKNFNTSDIEYIENQVLLNVNFMNHDNMIISTGGSAIYYPDAMEYLSKNSLIIFIDVSKKEILRRTKNLTNRGIIFKKNQTIYNFYKERYKLYYKYADLTIQENNIDIIINQIYKFFN